MATGKSSGIVIGIIGIIIGAVGVGIGGYAFVTFREEIDDLVGQIEDLEEELDEKSSVQKTWYDESVDAYAIIAENNYEVIPNLSVTFSLRENEAVYLLYTGRAFIFEKTGFSYVKAHFRIDGEILNKPYTEGGGYNLEATQAYFSLVLQHSNTTLSAGTHTVSVVVYAKNAANIVSENTLLVQTYIP